MRARVVAFACAFAFALSAGACLYPEYGVKQDGGTAGTAGTGAGGRGGTNAGAAGTGGAVAGAGRGGSATATAGTSGGGSSGAAGSISGLAGTGGGSAGRGGTTGVGGGPAGAGGGPAGAGGSSAGRGGTTGVGGGPVGTGGGSGRGGSTGVGGTGGGVAGRGGTTGVGGSGGGVAGRGGTTGAGGVAGSGVAGAGGSTAPPSWLGGIAVVYQFDSPTQGFYGVEAHGDETLHLEEQGPFLPVSSTTAIEGRSAGLPGTGNNHSYFQSRTGAGLPSVFATPPGTSFTLGGWFRVDPAVNDNLQYLINDEGPGSYQGGFVFYLDQQLGNSFGTSAASAYCRIGTSETNFNYKEVQTVTEVGPDPVVGNRWVHLVCRFDASSNLLSIFVAGVRTANNIDTTHPIKTGPGPFMLSCDQSFCPLTGNMDEVFYATTALPDEDIIRIYACGIDGARCRCSGSNYFNCGFVPASSCGSLPACNAPTP